MMAAGRKSPGDPDGDFSGLRSFREFGGTGVSPVHDEGAQGAPYTAYGSGRHPRPLLNWIDGA